MICRSDPYARNKRQPESEIDSDGHRPRGGVNEIRPATGRNAVASGNGCLSWEEVELWVQLAQDGHAQAWEVIVRHFYRRVHRYILTRLRNQSIADDLTQEAFLLAFRHVGKLRQARAFPAWLRTLTRRLVRQHLRQRNAVAQRSSPGADAAVPRPGNFRGALERLETEEQLQVLRTALESLRLVDRQTLEGFYLRGQTLRQMSQQFGCPVGTLKRRLHTARTRLLRQFHALQFG